MKVIPTAYAGCRFRSRLEARWAVFFDAVGVAWQYEPEGYDLGGAGWYLPDFRVTTLDGRTVWVEVRPIPATAPQIENHLDRRELIKLRTFALLADHRLYVVGEFPAPGQVELLHWTWGILGPDGDRWFRCAESFGAAPLIFQGAWQDARGARFEFGESGAA